MEPVEPAALREEVATLKLEVGRLQGEVRVLWLIWFLLALLYWGSRCSG